MANALAWVSAASVVSYILQQDFESAGTPTGWSGTGSVTFHNTSSPLEGTGDLDLVGHASPDTTALSLTSSTASECWMVFLFKIISFSSSGSSMFIELQTSAGSPSGGNLQFTSSGGCKMTIGFTGSANTAGNLSSGTLYYAKMHFLKGTGSNAQGSIEFSTTGTWTGSGSLFASVTNGDSTIDIGKFVALNLVDGDYRLDHIRVSTTDLGNSFSSWT